MKMILLLCLTFVLAVVAYEAYKIADTYTRARPLLAVAQAFQKETGSMRVLIAGDSTGVGTGATEPEDSVAGRLSRDNPDFAVHNISQNGLRIAGLLTLLRSLPKNDRYALILLQIGGNDILRLASTNAVREDLRALFAEAKKRGERVALISTGDIGNAPAFGPLLSWLYEILSKKYRAFFIAESAQAGILYVDLYEPKESDPFALEPARYHAADGLHPSSDGYALWYGKLRTLLEKSARPT
jgi:lysophospholipase L1-like esterase